MDHGRKFLIVTAGTVGFVGCVGTLCALLYKKFNNVHGEDRGQDLSVLAECTCADTQQISCRRHDYSLLWKLSKCLPNEDLMYGIGLDLHVDVTEIEASRVNNSKNINRAVYDMLLKWYRTQDGLGQNSNGLEKLKRALCENQNCGLVQTVIQKHFDER